MKQHKVLFVIDTLETGGTEKSLLATVSKFKYIKPIVCQIYNGETLRKEFDIKGIKTYALSVDAQYGFIESYNKLKIVVEKEQPALMVGYLTRSELVTRLLGRNNKIPVLGTFVSDLYSISYNSNLNWKSRSFIYLFKLLNRYTARYCCGFVANSNSIKESNSMHLKVPLHKVQVIYRGRESNMFKYQPAGISEGKIHFLNIGRLVPVKGQKNLIIAFKKLLEFYPNIYLDIVGDGPLFGELNSLVHTLNINKHVRLLGNRTDVDTIINKYNCFIFPSLSEGFSGAVVEAMFAGLPVVASDIPSNKESIEHLKSGYLFEKGSIDAIHSGMEWYLHHREEAAIMAQVAYDIAIEKFELNAVVDQFETYLLTKIKNT